MEDREEPDLEPEDDTLGTGAVSEGGEDSAVCTVVHPTASVYRGSLIHGR